MVTLEQLSCFKAVYELNSYSKAARATHKTRATVRERVKALEDTLGFELFETQGKAVLPTKSGIHLYPRADNLTRQSKEFYNVALSTFSTAITSIVLHHDDLIPLCLLSDIDDAIEREFPDISINWLQRDRAASLKDIESGDALFSIMPTVGKIFPNTKVGIVNLGTYQYAPYTSVNSGISQQGIDLNELTTEDFCSPKTRYSMRCAMPILAIANIWSRTTTCCYIKFRKRLDLVKHGECPRVCRGRKTAKNTHQGDHS